MFYSELLINCCLCWKYNLKTEEFLLNLRIYVKLSNRQFQTHNKVKALLCKMYLLSRSCYTRTDTHIGDIEEHSETLQIYTGNKIYDVRISLIRRILSAEKICLSRTSKNTPTFPFSICMNSLLPSLLYITFYIIFQLISFLV